MAHRNARRVDSQREEEFVTDDLLRSPVTRRRLLTGVAAVAGSAALPATAGSAHAQATPTAEAPAVEGTPAVTGVPGGTLRVTLGAEPDTLDPHKGDTLFDIQVFNALYDALINDDISEQVKGDLAESWDSPDGTTWTFKLRPGMTFHDGSPIDSSAVKATFTRIQDPATGAVGSVTIVANQVGAIDTPDPATVVFTLKAASAIFPIQTADIKIIPTKFDATKPVGSGPFKFVEWVRNQHVSVAKNPNYYKAGLPLLDGVTFLPTPDENQKIVLLQTGGVDMTDTLPLARAQEIQKAGQFQVFSIPKGVAPSTYFVLCKTTDPLLSDARVRQAMNFAIDRKALDDAVFNFGAIKSNFIPPQNWAFNPNALSFNDRDVDKAKSLLQAAGHGDGFKIQLKHITSRAEYTDLAQIFQANMADIGIQVEIVPKEIGVWVQEVLVKHDFQLGMTGELPGDDPDLILTTYVNDEDGAAMAWKDDEFLSLLAKGRATVGQEARKPIYDRAQVIVQEASPGFVLHERPILLAASPAVQGFKVSVRQFLHFESVWLKK
jgi:peptide/nickel transport system substrate-binding protein